MVQKWIFFTLLWIFALLPTGRVARNTTGKQREVVCGNIDIRNQVSSFDQLKNCTVIEGNLQILLLDYAEPDDYKHLSYPRLVEITDYLLLYRVYGLKSLSDIFPNLTVIRGQRLFHNYALVAYEMQDLENLGLRSLTTIVRGGVRLEKNSHLCYIDTLDWSIIASQVSENGHFFKDNQEIDKCVNICPRDSNNKDKCPTMKNNPKQALCWDEKHCQKVPQDCTHGDCCHRECLGGCYGKGADQCVACKNLLFEGRCWPECPLDTLQYRQHRCIKEDDCKKMGKSSLRKQTYWKIHNRHCLKECPYGFTESKVDKHKCEKCNGPCPKECVGHVVDSVASAQALKGCTVITGELEIQIRGGNHVGKELEINLGSIENITAYLKIVRSDAIMSLRFLKNLRVIDGKLLWNNKYSLVLVDNSNLEDIWDFNTHPNLTLKKGRMFIHHNRKLCMHIVRRLIAQVGLTNQTDNIDVSKTNGDQVACNVTTLNLEVIRTRDSFAVIRWNNFRTNDPRSLLSFVVNYRESPEKNLTMYTTRDACGTDVWKTEDVRPDSDRNAKEMITMLYPLEPWTQYAVYVLTYTVSSSSHGAISPIKYFTTEPAVPSPPTDIEVVARATGELTVSWKPPIKPNGNVTHYYVYWQPQPLNPRAFDRRNYCHDKLQLVDKKKKSELEEKEDGKGNKTDGNCCTCCTCPKSKKDQKREEAERLFQIEFQNSLHDSVYIKRPGKFKKNAGKGGRTKRSTNPWNKYLDMENTNWTMIADGNLSDAYINATAVNTSEEESIHLPYLSAMVYGTEILLPDLEHYKEYSIEVIACHEYDVQTEEKMCSNRGITAARTLPSLDADTIDPRNISVNNYTSKDGGGEVQLYWKEPASPNGLILTYEIEYKKVERKNIKPEVLCIPHKEYRVREGYVIKALPAGNYSFRIRATSLAGNGSWTVTKFFYLTDNKPTVESWRGEIIAGVATATGLVVVLGVAGLVWVVAKKRYNQNIPDQVWYASVNPEYVSAGDIYIADEWEVDRDKIKLIRELGQGSFGMVYEGTVKGLDGDKDEIKVAVKTVNENASIRDRIEFLNEASVMKGFICNHVVKLLGVVSKSQPTLVIMELMANGDLKTFLRKHRPEEEDNNGQDPPSLKRILQMAGEIADGMAYLADKKFVHRDLAARNCMVAENLIVKIGDFGMTRDIYETDYYRKGGKGLLPVRWMGPESLRDGVFTSMSDVWSYGIVLWEMATLAAQPYQGLANEQVLKYVIDGGLMEKPEGCPDKLYDLMVLCWKHNPKQRPTFQEIIEMLVPDLDPSFHELSYFFSEDNRHDRIDSEEDEKTPLKGSPSGPDLELDEVSIDNSYGRLSPGPKRSMYSLHSNCSKKHSPSQCDCVDIIKDADKVKRKGSRNSNCPGGIDVHSNDGSKESSKSSGSSHSRLNGMANGHIPIMPNYTEC